MTEWLRRQALACAPRERLTGNEWAERFRVLGDDESSQRPGMWVSEPWQVDILDALADHTLDWIVIRKPAQIGVSELIRCAIGRWALYDPGDVLWVMSTQDAAKKAMRKLHAMFRNTPALRGLVSQRKRDTALLETVLASGMRIVIGWAGSPDSLASDPFRYVILDEVAKYAWSAKGEGSPVGLAKQRTKTFGRRRKVVMLSTPKHEDDHVCVQFGQTLDQQGFAAPCPHCGVVQVWSWDQARWEEGGASDAPSDVDARVMLAAKLEAGGGGWLECASCAAPVTEAQKRAAYRDPRARWERTREVPGDQPLGRRRAYQIDDLLHWEITISLLAAEFLQAIEPRARQDFWNSHLGRPYHTERSAIPRGLYLRRAIYPPDVVPDWATTVISTADTQANGWYLRTQAWGKRKTRLIRWRFVETEEELLELGLRARFQVEGSNHQARIHRLGIDAGGGMADPDGSRTKMVYRIGRENPRVVVFRGEGGRDVSKAAPYTVRQIAYAQAGKRKRTQEVIFLNADYWKDETAGLIRAEGLWEECEQEPEALKEYARQMASERKVGIDSGSGVNWTWRKRAKHAPNHLWDCAYMNVALAEIAGTETRTKPAWYARRRPASGADEGWLIGR